MLRATSLSRASALTHNLNHVRASSLLRPLATTLSSTTTTALHSSQPSIASRHSTLINTASTSQLQQHSFNPFQSHPTPPSHPTLSPALNHYPNQPPPPTRTRLSTTPLTSSIDPTSFRNAFRSAASSVWVITSAAGGVPVGFTAISISSVSVNPPMLSFNISKTSSSLATLQESFQFAVHLLDNSSAAIEQAKRFASKPSDGRFADRSTWAWDKAGVPTLSNSLVRMSGRIVSLTEAGDSWLAVGLVEDVERQEGVPLLHYSGAYREMGCVAEQPAVPTVKSPPIDKANLVDRISTSVITAAAAAAKGVKGANGTGAQHNGGSSSTAFSASSSSSSPTSTSLKRRMYLNGFDMTCVGHQSPGVWSHPQDQSYRYKDLSYWTELAQILERGHFDTLFLADVLGTYDVYQGSRTAAVRQGAQVPVNDPVPAIAAMAAVTKRLGFAVTVSLTYEQPYSFARRMSTLDHLTNGRVAWNIVTSYLQSAAVNLGLSTQIGHDERYNLAEEFMEVCYKLWEGSWEDDAVVRDRRNRIFTHPDRIHDINHDGKYYKVPGVHLCEPSPQRTPVLFQAGASSKGQKFAARHAEGMFVIGLNPKGLRKLVDGIRRQATEVGRDPRSVKIFALVTPIVAETDEAAQAKYAEYQKYSSQEGALALYGGWTGVDLSTVDPDAPLVHVENDSLRSVGEMLSKGDPGKVWTAAEVAKFIGVGGMGPVIVGSPTTVADQLEHWMEVADVDGFNFAYAVTPGTFVDFVDLVVPELRKRGVVPSEQDDSKEGETLRERLGQGSPKLRADHPGSEYRKVLSEYKKKREELVPGESGEVVKKVFAA